MKFIDDDDDIKKTFHIGAVACLLWVAVDGFGVPDGSGRPASRHFPAVLGGVG